MKFIDRINEIDRLNSANRGLIVLFGRRRVGKTSLAEEWAKGHESYYSQALEGSVDLQILQATADLKEVLPKNIVPRSWSEFFASLSLINKEVTIILDEFPYLVKTSPELPSVLQKWIDHDRPKGLTLILLGSSQTMMHGIFLQSSSPLYERATEILHLLPLSYKHFCLSCEIDFSQVSNFELFSLVGGVPKYWEYINTDSSVVENATNLYFQKSARLESEPDRLLKDENISGTQAKSMLEIIGRGASRPSEIAARLNVAQSSLSSAFQMLLHASLVDKQGPFPDLSKESKKVLYSITDFALRFWYRVYSPHRSRWHLYKNEEREKLIHDHAATVLEDSYRAIFKDAKRYWEGSSIEIDCIRYGKGDLKSVIISEIKHSSLSDSIRREESRRLEEKFYKSALSAKFKLQSVEVLDTIDVVNAMVESE